ncbi:hypothetical protein A2819_01955 [Candidatus Azambacteria bacterium RIFCSPHIGHO2_01_FULL_40_24]|uniref:Zinc-binding domain-containing protein n=1 Tax=Candidatus Azambacteria bacterium RIFCSPHIGHO2_01_FULL_40_24 TaxID=1797301 RepID=A0A1F5B3I5_9BACT|nr:MAG: hypothetical protein A2819_01955 [Candidatus Azambacteria bacterium RIFCSPHIGHO2_01_FULL_40_24]
MEYKSENRICQNCKNDFIIEPDDFGFYEKIKVPPPTFCPECRSQRRLAWRNDFVLYNRICDLCKKSVVTIYSKESSLTVYCNKCWWSDNWDPLKYGQKYDFSRTFFEQLKELTLKVPHMALINDNGIASVNCEYTNDFAFGKNCYMVFVAWYIENVMYSFHILAGKNIMDSMINMSETEYLYECINCTHGYMLKYSEYSRACIDSQFLYDCQDCSNCFMCAELRSKKYHFKNKRYSKEEYEKILASYQLDTFSGVEKARKEFNEFILSYPRRYAWLKKNENSAGDIVSYSKNTKDSFVTKKSENCRFCEFTADAKECYDIATGGELSECYEDITCDQSSRNLFGIFSWKSQDVEYTQHCHSSKSLFGCVGLRSKKYCILNKQYSKEEYEALVKRIKKQMSELPYKDSNGCIYKYGEFYPAELSYFGYNETVADERYPLDKEIALSKNFKWQNNIQKTTGQETLKPENIPEGIDEVEDSILEKVLACINCRRNYKIIPNELIFYRKMRIPIPRRCFYCRHEARLKRRNPFKLWHRECMCDKETHHNHQAGKCSEEFETSYAPERPEIIYCEKCYQAEVY